MSYMNLVLTPVEVLFFGAPRIELGLSAPKADVLPVYYAPKKGIFKQEVSRVTQRIVAQSRRFT